MTGDEANLSIVNKVLSRALFISEQGFIQSSHMVWTKSVSRCANWAGLINSPVCSRGLKYAVT